MALLGPAPAVAMGWPAGSTDALRSRTRGIMLLNNLATYATFPLIGALVLEWIQDSGADPGRRLCGRGLRRLHRSPTRSTSR